MSTDITERETQEYLKKLTVLYIEDEECSRELCSEFLSRLVGVLVTAHNGAEGLEAWRLHKPDIIITDILMPVMDGLTMLQEIRSADYLAKPVKKDELAAILEKWGKKGSDDQERVDYPLT